MHKAQEMPLVAKDLPMQDVLLAMTAKRFGCVGVLDGETLIGIITDGDLRRHMGEGLLVKKASDVMTQKPITISPRTLASEALSIMNDKQITSLFALDEAGKPQGILHIHDCLRAGVQ